MPELPEVETVRRDLSDLVEGLTLKRLTIRDSRVVGQRDFRPASLHGRVLRRVGRRGKYLQLDFGDRHVMLHLRMTGKMLPESSPALPSQSLRDGRDLKIRAIWDFEGVEKLAFYDVRRFGTLDFLDDPEAYFAERHLAPDMLEAPDAALARFLTGLAATGRPVKAALLDQGIACGVGNIYADEGLHRLGLHPLAPAETLDARMAKRLFRAVQRVMASAIAKRGTSMSDYLDVNGNPGVFAKYLYVYGRRGELCKTCGRHAIAVVKVSGRSSHYCPGCQPEPEPVRGRFRSRNGLRIRQP